MKRKVAENIDSAAKMDSRTRVPLAWIIHEFAGGKRKGAL